METIPQPTTVPPAFLQMKKSLQTEFRAFCCRLKDSHPVWELVFKLSFEEILETVYNYIIIYHVPEQETKGEAGKQVTLIINCGHQKHFSAIGTFGLSCSDLKAGI